MPSAQGDVQPTAVAGPGLAGLFTINRDEKPFGPPEQDPGAAQQPLPLGSPEGLLRLSVVSGYFLQDFPIAAPSLVGGGGQGPGSRAQGTGLGGSQSGVGPLFQSASCPGAWPPVP